MAIIGGVAVSLSGTAAGSAEPSRAESSPRGPFEIIERRVLSCAHAHLSPDHFRFRRRCAQVDVDRPSISVRTHREPVTTGARRLWISSTAAITKRKVLGVTRVLLTGNSIHYMYINRRTVLVIFPMRDQWSETSQNRL